MKRTPPADYAPAPSPLPALPVTYIVRLYRFDPKQPPALAGTIERADENVLRGFHSAGELIDLMLPGTRERRR